MFEILLRTVTFGSGIASARSALPLALALRQKTPDYLIMVRLITHNLLACHVKGCTSNNFPLRFSDVQIELRDAEFNPDFLRGFLPKIEWQALVDAAKEVSTGIMSGTRSRGLGILISRFSLGIRRFRMRSLR